MHAAGGQLEIKMQKCSSAGIGSPLHLHYTGLRKIIYCPHVKKKGRKSGDSKAAEAQDGGKSCTEPDGVNYDLKPSLNRPPCTIKSHCGL
jgi:hypothetical protein